MPPPFARDREIARIDLRLFRRRDRRALGQQTLDQQRLDEAQLSLIHSDGICGAQVAVLAQNDGELKFTPIGASYGYVEKRGAFS